MTYLDSTDEELLAHAQQGVAPAFAVLLHRHGPAVLKLAEPDADPVGATVATYVRAMRSLSDADGVDIRDWLLQIAAREIDADVDPSTATLPPPATGRASEQTAGAGAPISSVVTSAVLSPRTEELDEVWAELALRWPTGRPPRHVPSWALWLGTTLLLIGLAIALPWAVLGASTTAEPAIEQLRASPVLEDLVVEEEEREEEEAEPLPTFDFPEPPADEAEAESQPEPAPPPAATAPPVETTPEPTPIETPVEEPVVETPVEDSIDEQPTEGPPDPDENEPIESDPPPEETEIPEPEPGEGSTDEEDVDDV